MTRVVFRHLRSDDRDVHVFRNFIEDVWRALKHEKGVDVSVAEIDRCVGTFEVRTKPALVRHVIEITKPVLKKHSLTETCQISVED